MKENLEASNTIDRIKIALTKYNVLILIFVVFGISWFYGYQDILFKRPQSIHSWRQCDGASLALCYYQEGMHFFKPQTQGLYSDNLKSGFTSPSEIPLLYYSVAFLYRIFGFHEYIFKAFDLLLFYLGLFYLFKFARLILSDTFYSLTVVILLFSSPVIVYYANNFLPNTGALSLSLIGWYYFYWYFLNKKTKTYLLSMLFFGLAGAMKITELSAPIIIAGFMLADRFMIIDLQLNAKKQFFVKMSALTLIFALVSGWVGYAKYFNNLHGSTQFSTFIFPVWRLDHDAIAFIFHKIHVIWIKEYYHQATFYFMIACFLLMIILHKRSNRILLFGSLIQFAGLLVYSLLWFEALGDHDYFFVSFYILPVFLFINFFFILRSYNLSRISITGIQILLVVLLLVNVIHAKKRTEIRYNSWMNDYSEMQDVYTIRTYLDKINIPAMDTIVYYSSLNIRPLYLMNLKGWTIRQRDSVDIESSRNDSLAMKQYKENGAKYLIVHDIKSLQNRESILPYTNHLIGKFGSVFIFRL